MKIQDVIFLIVLIGLLLLRKPRTAVVLGMVFILLSMPLFQLKVALFTAQRLVMYAAGLFLLNILFSIKSTNPPVGEAGVDYYKKR